ncbi:alsin isoform X2 [Leptidea sinapis]|uniref:alsin isoform X2 n=1 Tax=Leptidea sinapis TaxID=189913 RepID=UPI00213BB270|nr:alsin isoform X2 [Leptidea sinapis]
MSQHKFWNGITSLNVSFTPTAPEKVFKLCSLEKDFLALANDHSIFYCSIEDNSLHCKKINGIIAIDISYHNDILYVIDIHGRLYKTTPTFKCKDEIIVKEESKCCPHGFKSNSTKVKFRNVVTSDFGQLFISTEGQLWGSGDMPQIGLDNQEIKKIPFFEGRTVYSASIGQNFAAVIARKNVKEYGDCDTDSDNDDEEVFASNCSQCQSIIGLASPASMPSLSETCPLGVHISKSSEDSSSTTAPQTDVQVDAQSITEDSSPTSEESKVEKPISPLIENSVGANNIQISDIQDNTDKVGGSQTPQGSTEKLNNIFINTDAARQFLSRQLSWVSAGEDYLVEYTEKPTRIIKENVTNITNFVYEGVKTVGDKVATLSRHVSGSSDNNEATEFLNQNYNEEIGMLWHSCTSTKFEDIQFSTSTVSSEKEFEVTKKCENLKNMSKLGKNILATELWTWGDITHGQLGIGDTVKRVKPMVVMSLSGFGLQKVSCGKWHCGALTLDGRLFVWGYNNYKQVSLDTRDDRSSPKQFSENSESDRIRDMIATDNHTLAYTHNENIYYMGKHDDGFTENIVNLNERCEQESNQNKNSETVNIKEAQKLKHSQNMCYHWRILSSGSISYSSVGQSFSSLEFQNLSIAQRYLEEMLIINHSLVKPFLKKSKAITSHSNIYEAVCDIFSDILNITALNVLSTWQYAEKHISECDILLIKNLDEFIYLYKKYYIALSNLIVIGGFAQINNVYDISNNVYNLFNDQLPSNKQKNKKTQEAVIALAFIQPLIRLSSYKCIAQSLLRNKSNNKKADSKSNIEEKIAKVVTALDILIDEQDKKRKDADVTKLFWETVGKSLEQHRTPERRLIRESKSKQLNVVNPGRFSSHWFILFNNLFIHVNGSSTNIHPLETVWVEAAPNSDSAQNIIQLTTPEEILYLTACSEQGKSEWIHAITTAIKSVLKKDSAFKAPSIRTASYTFSSKSAFYKDATYIGRWLDGKVHGNGRVDWPDGRVYVGQFQINTLCGHGKMDIPGVGCYEGQWKDNLQNGYGIMKYAAGDIYEGYFKDGHPHGHGIKRQGDFTSLSATIYTGEWIAGVKQGYGVMDYIGKGEKYLGNWSDNKKHGCGLIVTLDGIYYEGLFTQDILTGHGVMVFEDGTHYEGEFRAAGIFSGKGVLTFSSGDRIEGSLNGAWTEGVKITNGVMHMNVSNPALPANSKPNSFGKLSVAPNQKWNALFRQCFHSLGVPETILTPTGNHFANGPNPTVDNVKIWQKVAVAISCSQKEKHVKSPIKSSSNSDIEKSVDCLEVIPTFGQKILNLNGYMELKQYVYNACESSHHPLGQLVLGLTNAFNTTYGGVRVHPLLLSHAVKELKSITSRLYQVVRLLFPALPPEGSDVVLPYKGGDENSDGSDNSNPIEGKFWPTSTLSPTHPPKEQKFQEAVETLQQLKTTFSPIEKLLVIRSTFQKMTDAVQHELGAQYLWSMDELFPVFHFVVVRARILQLGSEIHFVEDFLEPAMQHGELGLMFTTLKACYFQILQEKMSINAL